ncbi:hypothetical protein ACFPVT_10295 [Corynebacterium choanae]|uniref:Uncharacterized protein n=1 Tax=Corynebacterium choanae TaxID=1862358 RepID=A0A3G6J464_9CORY|nr:hypothetical protein [Corynebacterium choanae]AZA12807.1 hypothetical protein CCHOA_01900 [Corynebacterium choanae]
MSELADNIFDTTVTTIDGDVFTVGNYEGHVLLLVIVDPDSDRLAQLAELQEVFDEFYMRGFFCVAVVTEDFATSPHSAEDIANTLRDDYGVTFPIVGPIPVTGEQQAELISVLLAAVNDADEDAVIMGRGPIAGGFEKFLIDPEGAVIGRFPARMEPSAHTIVDLIDSQVPVQ